MEKGGLRVSVRVMWYEKDSRVVTDRRGKDEPRMQAAARGWKRQENRSSLSDTLILSQKDPFQTSDLQDECQDQKFVLL